MYREMDIGDGFLQFSKENEISYATKGTPSS